MLSEGTVIGLSLIVDSEYVNAKSYKTYVGAQLIYERSGESQWFSRTTNWWSKSGIGN